MAGKNRDGLRFPEPTFEQSAPGMVRPVQSCLWTFGGFRGRLVANEAGEGIGRQLGPTVALDALAPFPVSPRCEIGRPTVRCGQNTPKLNARV